MVNIVVALDESEESMRACEWVCKHLLSTQTEIQQSYNFILLHVQPTSCVSTGPAYIPSDKVFELFELQTKRTTQRILKRALNICDRYYVKAKTHVVIGKASERICEAAAEFGAHFLVVGSHGHGTFIRAIRGSDRGLHMVQLGQMFGDRHCARIKGYAPAFRVPSYQTVLLWVFSKFQRMTHSPVPGCALQMAEGVLFNTHFQITSTLAVGMLPLGFESLAASQH